MELRHYVNVLRRWWWLILLATAVAAASSILAVARQPSIYAAETTLMTGDAMQRRNVSYDDIYLSQDLNQTYAALAKERSIRTATMAALGLNWLPEYTVNVVPSTQLMKVRVVDTSPERGVAVANELARQLVLSSPSAADLDTQQRQEYVRGRLQKLQTNIDETEARIATLQQQLDDMFSARQIADTNSQIAALEQKRSDYESNYAALLNFSEGGVNTLRVVWPAELPEQPIGPNRPLTVLLAIVIGALLGLGAAFLLEYLDDTLKGPDDVKEALGISTLAAIARIEGETPGDRLVTARHPKSPNAEAYRILRTNLQFSTVDQPSRTLLVTSSNPVEGKSTTLANLAVVLAQQGQRVIAVDSDLRRPTLHHILSTPNNAGLTNALLLEHPTGEGLLQETEVENLQVLTSGPLPPNPAELLGSQRFALLMADLQQRADVVLFDSPPVLAVTDAAMLARQVDGVLLVIDAGVTRRQWAANALEALAKVNANVLGAAVNRLQANGSGYYYYYYRRYYGSDDDGSTGQSSGRSGRGGSWWRRRGRGSRRERQPAPAAGQPSALGAHQASSAPGTAEN